MFTSTACHAHHTTGRCARLTAYECLGRLLPADFSGILQCDGYSAYGAFARRHPHPIVLAGCWAHVRRNFHEAREEAPRRAGWVLRQIQHLYRVEAELREKRAGPQLREAVRGAQSRMVIQRLRRVLERMRPKTLSKSLLGEAIAFALEQWPRLEVFLTDGRVEIDNNQIENAIQPTAVGKKNWLFVGDADAGERGAILYTVMQSCRRRGIDPFAYLRDVLTRLPTMTNHQVVDLLPANWAGAQAPALKAEA